MKLKVLVIRFSSIGDLVLTTPVLRCLFGAGYEVHLLVKPAFKDVLACNPFVEKIHEFSSVGETASELKKEGFHFVADLQNNLKSNLLCTRLGVKHASFPKLNIQKWILVNFKVNQMPEKHIVDRYFEAVKSLNVNSDDAGLDFFVPEKDQVDVEDFTGNGVYRYHAVVVGAAHATKQIPEKKLVLLAKHSPKPVVLIGGPNEAELGERVRKKYPDKVFNACGKVNLNQSAWLVKQAYHVVTPDTGMMHIAAAFQKTITVVWGNTVPEFGMYPYLPERNWKSMQVPNLSCRPCSKIGHEECPKKHFDCMKKQKINEKSFSV